MIQLREEPGVRPNLAPAQSVQEQPWSFVMLALGLGLTAGVLLRIMPTRRVLRLAFSLWRVI